jgi:hypothetical protein
MSGVRATVIGVVVALAVLAAPAAAQDLAEAERLFREGVALSEAERWGEAAEYFRRALAIAERPSTVCNYGVALYHLGQAREAGSTLARCLELAEGSSYAESHPEQLAAARRFRDELAAAVGTLELALAPADALVLVDGEPVDGSGSPRRIEIDPGRHAVLVSAPGYRTFRDAEVSVLSGSTVPLSVSLERLPARPATLVVESLEGAQIRIDGEVAGVGRVEEQLPATTVDVRVDVEGHPPLERTVTLSEGETVRIDASFAMTTGDLAAEPWFWAVVGAGVLALGGAIAATVVATQPSDPFAGYGGNAAFVFTPLVVPW